MSALPAHAVFIDPSSEHFLQDRLFDTSNTFLNRDGTLLPFGRLKSHLQAQGIPVHTADRLRDGSVRARMNHYWSLGMLNGYAPLLGRDDVRLRGFFLLEPPLVAAHMYRQLPALSTHFEQVFVHNTVGDGYSLQGVHRDRLHKLHWPQPYDDALEPYWSVTQRQNKLVAIAGLHNPRFRKPEYYSKRIEAVAALHKADAIDLYGRGWERWWTHHAASYAYWRHWLSVKRSYRGAVANKMETLSQYRFSLCFENMPMQGYLTEKLFDCLYAGTVPIYLGAPDIASLVPPEVYVDMRDYGVDHYAQMWAQVSTMSDEDWQRKREAGRAFLRGAGRALYYDSLVGVVGL